MCLAQSYSLDREIAVPTHTKAKRISIGDCESAMADSNDAQAAARGAPGGAGRGRGRRGGGGAVAGRTAQSHAQDKRQRVHQNSSHNRQSWSSSASQQTRPFPRKWMTYAPPLHPETRVPLAPATFRVVSYNTLAGTVRIHCVCAINAQWTDVSTVLQCSTCLRLPRGEGRRAGGTARLDV